MQTSRPCPLELRFLVSMTLLAGTLAGCHDRPAEPVTVHDAGAPVAAGPASPHDVHHIIDADHRRVIHLAVDDKIVLPNDPVFDWHVDFEDKGSFVPFTGDAGQGATPTYRAAQAGLFRMMVYGDPKCLVHDGGCGISKRRWDITAEVR
jgi:hypothetical protein